MMLEHIYYITEALGGHQKLNEKFLERSMLSLYNGEMKNRIEKEIKHQY